MVYEHTCYPQSGSPLPPLRGEMSRSDRGGVGATAPLRVRAVGRDPPQPAAAPPARGGAGSGSPLHPLRGEMSRSDRGGVGATAPLRVRAVGRDPPSACGSSPARGERDPDPLSPPCGGRCHGVTEGGSARQRPAARAWRAGEDPPSACGSSPRKGGAGNHLFKRVEDQFEHGVDVAEHLVIGDSDHSKSL